MALGSCQYLLSSVYRFVVVIVVCWLVFTEYLKLSPCVEERLHWIWMGAFCGSYSGISHMSAWATQMSVHDGQCSQRFRGDCGTGQQWWGGVLWGLPPALLALTHRGEAGVFLLLGSLKGAGLRSHAAKLLLFFPTSLSRG